MYTHRQVIKKLGMELQQHNKSRGSGFNLDQLAKSKHARVSFVAQTEAMHWLLPKFDKFKPTHWYFGIVLLSIRLVQTCLMALARKQLHKPRSCAAVV